MDYHELERANWAIGQVAEQFGMPVEDVLREMESVFAEGYANQDPAIQAEWAQIPRAGEVPTATEVVAYLAWRLTMVVN